MKKYGDKASFGRRQEYAVIAELLCLNFDVYSTLVDDQGIDCVIRLDGHRYLDVQIKARSDKAQQWYLFAAMTIEPRDNFFFVFYIEKNDTFWVLPSKDVVALASRNVKGKNVGKYSLAFPKSDAAPKAASFAKYKGQAGFSLLRDYMSGGAA